ncbi:MAG: hypothetical protein JOZ59_07060 [Candidatus Eremiobacteraeota bacterium]|nr:hypothetical protein [Candidatus Eremiobacteraeota bacterium]
MTHATIRYSRGGKQQKHYGEKEIQPKEIFEPKTQIEQRAQLDAAQIERTKEIVTQEFGP